MRLPININDFLNGMSVERQHMECVEAMEKNGSPPAEFEFDDDHSYFMVRLPIHPAALEVAESAARGESGATRKVGADETAAGAGTKSGPG